MRVLGLALYPSEVASTRFRLTAMAPFFEERGHQFSQLTVFDAQDLRVFYGAASPLEKAWLVAARTARFLACLQQRAADVILLQRGVSIVGPALTEVLLARRVPTVFDFDDAIWTLDAERSKNPIAARLFKAPTKAFTIMKHSALVIAGSRYLGVRAQEYNRNVMVVPTVVSARTWTPRERSRHAPARIGWIGTHTTSDQLQLVAPALQRLAQRGRDFELFVTGAPESFSVPAVKVEHVPWEQSREVELFRNLDIGLAPMRDLAVYEGKCGFKQLQYMAVGVPQVSSAVGGARDFLRGGVNALVPQTSGEWESMLDELLGSPELGHRLADAGRELVESEYSLEVQGPRVVRAVENCR